MAAPSRPPRRIPPSPPKDDEEEEEVEEEEEKQEEHESEDKMYRFTDNDENYSVKKFFDLFNANLPQTVVVTQGQYGDIDLDTFCAGQVMYIHSYASQNRVITRDARGRTFTIPVDYPMKFKVVKSRTKEGEEQSLQEIIDENKLPQQVKLAVPPQVTFYIGPDQQKAKDIHNMVLVDVYPETYMMANCINTKRLDRKAILVPVYLQDAALSTVSGIEGKSPEQWEEYKASLDADMKTITVDIKPGNKDIAFISEDCLDVTNNVYDYIEPKNFMKMSVEDDTGYGVLVEDPDSIYAAVDEDKVEVPKPPLPERQKSNEKKPKKGSDRNKDKPEIPSRSKIPESEKAKMPENAAAHGYVNEIPRSEVAPMRVLKGLGFGKKHESSEKSSEVKLEDISVKDLSINDLGKKLKELKLGRHVAAFKKQLIDGSIAMDLTKDILQNDFGFTAVEAIKMMQFINSGHIPR